jgi:RNA polymerase sigma-70 factor (ECF subfamily)
MPELTFSAEHDVMSPQPVSRSRADQLLVELCYRSRAGDVSAFSDLYRVTSPRIYGLALRVLRSPEHAAEVTQEVYLDVWRRLPGYDPLRGSVMTWMTTIAHRRSVDRVRSVSATTSRDQRYAEGTRLQDVDGVWDAVASHSDAVEVRQALGRLNAVQREALVLAYFGGHTHSNIALLLDLPLGTVKTRIRSALSTLRQGLQQAAS